MLLQYFEKERNRISIFTPENPQMNSSVVITYFLMVCVSSLHAQSLQTADSLEHFIRARISMDSISVITWSDSLRSKVKAGFDRDSLNLTHRLDSLRSIELPTNSIQQRLDSLVAKKDALLKEVEVKRESLMTQSRERIMAWRDKAREKLRVAGVSDLPNVPGGGVPDLNVPGAPDVNVPDLPDVNLNRDQLAQLGLPEMPALDAAEFNNLDLSPELASINESIRLPEFDQMGDVQEYLSKGDEALSSVSQLQTNTDAVVEQSLQKVAGASEVQEQLQLAEGIRDNEFMEAAEKMKDPEAMKEEVKQKVVKKAVNHFAGREQVLQAAMDKMSKYKAKYESLNSLSEIGKRPPNPMKNKPFLERLVPGVALQIFRNENINLDINPYIGYRLSGRFTAGLGWNQRIGYSTKENYFTSPAVVYGPRTFVEAKVWRGFSGRVEAELMNTVVPPAFKPLTPDITNREWVWSFMAGIKKEYRFIKSVKGTAFIMFNLYDPKNKSPYGDVLNTRFGFEFPLKKQKGRDKKEGSAQE